MYDEKIALLLMPGALTRSNHLIGSIHIRKKVKRIDLQIHDLNPREIKEHFTGLPKQVKDSVTPFCPEHLFGTFQEISKRLNQTKAGVSRETFVQNAILRHLHGLLENLKPFTNMVKWYHRVEQGKGKSLTAPCKFSLYKPQLSFEVIKEDGGFALKHLIVLNGSSYDINGFKRHCFLLESNNEYFILSFRDYQSLEWLEHHYNKKRFYSEMEFSQQILHKLEENYPVNRNDLFTKKQVQTTPVNRIQLSELNNSFLMLIPQWNYDGFLLEGSWKETQEKVVEGEVFTIVRNKEQEQQFLDFIISLHPKFINQRNGYFYLSFAEAQKKQWFLKVYHQLLELGIELTGMDMLQHFRYSSYKAETKTSIIKEVDREVILKMTVHFGSEKIDLKSLQKMLLAGQKAVLLKDSSLGILGDDWMLEFATIVKHGKIDKDEIQVAKYMAISEQQAADETKILTPLLKEQWWKKWREWQLKEENIYTVPSTINATLRPYQHKGFEWLMLMAEAGAGGCLADDMGLGKTLQTICFIAKRLAENPVETTIIVCPSSLIYNWQQELQKFAPGISSLVYYGINRNAEDLDKNFQVIITSYSIMRVDASILLAKSFTIAVIDESHNIKNPSAQITSVVSMLNAKTRIALSGTPVVNNTFDLYAQMNFAIPGMFGSREFFRREYANEIDRNHDEEKIKVLHKLTAPFILRRTKEQVEKDLPEKTEMILWCNMHREQQDLYNDIKDQIRSSLFLEIKNNGLNKSKLGVIQGMLKLRQVCNSPMLLPPEEQQHCKQSAKTEMLLRELQNILGEHKALVFSQFSTMLKLLAIELDKKGIKYYHFDGQTPAAKRTEMVNAFQQKDSETHLFLISLKAGNTGLTLTAADYVFLFDPWWNTAVEQQAIDRTHRIGQTKNVFAYKLICRNTIEEKIIDLQKRKKKLAEELVTEDDSFIKSLNEEDIAYLFS